MEKVTSKQIKNWLAEQAKNEMRKPRGSKAVPVYSVHTPRKASYQRRYTTGTALGHTMPKAKSNKQDIRKVLVKLIKYAYKALELLK